MTNSEINATLHWTTVRPMEVAGLALTVHQQRDAGHSIKVIGAANGIGCKKVYSILASTPDEILERAGEVERVQRSIWSAYKAGATYDEMAARHGMTRSTVHTVLLVGKRVGAIKLGRISSPADKARWDAGRQKSREIRAASAVSHEASLTVLGCRTTVWHDTLEDAADLVTNIGMNAHRHRALGRRTPGWHRLPDADEAALLEQMAPELAWFEAHPEKRIKGAGYQA